MRRSRLTWIVLALVPACTRDVESLETAHAGPSAEQTAVLEALETESHSSWQASFDAKTGTARHLEGRLQGALTAGEKPSAAALSFLSTHKQLFRMGAPEAELTVRRDRADALGMQHVRFGQQVGGVVVAGVDVFVHFGKDGSLATVDSTYVPDLSSVNLTPAFDTQEALAVAIGDFGANRPKFGPGQFWRPPIVELVVLPTGVSAKLAYHVRLHVRSVDPSHMDYMIDASTRAILRKYENLQTATPTTGSGRTSDNLMVTLQISEDGANFTLEDMTRTPKGIRTFTYGNQPNSTCSADLSTDGCLEQWINAHPHGDLLTSTDKTAWDTVGNNKGAAVDAHLYAGYVYDYYKSKFNRKGIDDADMEIQSNVHFATSFANAFWDGIGMVYGDGDTIQLKLTTKGYDVIAHELTHGVTEHESGLEYHDQPGALNESLSDVMAAFAEHVSFPDPTNNWLVGEKVAGLLLGTKLRDMVDPGSVTLSPQPDNMSKYNATTEDNGGVHINSGIPNNAAYLMTMGGTNKTSKIAVTNGIGWEKAEQVWYRAATQYFGATSDFKAAAQGTLSAAADLGYSESNKATIECAWIAVGVITTPSACRTVIDDGGTTIDTAAPDGGGGPTTDGGGSLDSRVTDAAFDIATRDAGADASSDTARPVPDGGTSSDASSTDAPPTSDVTLSDTSSTSDAPNSNDAPPQTDAGAGGSGGAGPSTTKPTLTAQESAGCGCRVPGAPPSNRSTGVMGSALMLLLGSIRRRTRKIRLHDGALRRAAGAPETH
ncbi:MAG TPA: M4 family metallopeptidase [Polyangiaceae bacterium]|nr:M4 family metallopeptidase [Polyangiaceae bacterium]